MAIKQVTCAPATLTRAALQKGITVAFSRSLGSEDVIATPVPGKANEVALRGLTLQGDLFLSLMMVGAIG